MPCIDEAQNILLSIKISKKELENTISIKNFKIIKIIKHLILKDNCNLGKQDFFRYLQLRQYFLKEIIKHETNNEPNEIIQLIVQAYKKA